MAEPCPTFDPLDTWLGLDHYFSADKCEASCTPCPTEGTLSVGVPNNGTRWLAPNLARQGRDATGKYSPLVAGSPLLIPKVADFLAAPCYHQNGRECHDDTVCNCDPQIAEDWSDAHPNASGCMDGTRWPQPVRHKLADDFMFTGNNYPNQSSIRCRTEYPAQLGQLPVEASGTPMRQAAFIRSKVGCMANLLALCIGKKISGNPDDCMPGEEPHFHNDSAMRQWWGRFYVDEIEIDLAHRAVGAEELDAVHAAERQALAFVNADRIGANLLRLDQMLHNNIAHPNGDLGSWIQSYQCEMIEDAPVYARLPNCRLRYTRLPFRAELVILSGWIRMHMVLMKINDFGGWPPSMVGIEAPGDASSWPRPPVPPQAGLWPSIRLQLKLELAARAWFTEGNKYKGREFRIDNPTRANGWRHPRLTPDLDVMHFVDSHGRTFPPPTYTEWWGSRQAISTGGGKWENVWPDGEPDGSIIAVCAETARAMSDIRLNGAPDRYNPAKINHYLGHVEVSCATS